MYVTLVCAGGALLCAWALAWIYTRRARACFAALPCFPTVPILGNVLKLVASDEAIYDLLVDMSEKIEDEQKPLVFWFGPLPALILSNPEDVKMVTNAYIEKPYFYNFARMWVGEGLVTASATTWKKNIKKLAGSFIGPIVDGYQGVFNAQGQKLVQNLRAEAEGAPFDVMKKYLAFATLESICQTALGYTNESEKLVTKEYYDAFSKTLELLLHRGINFLLHPDWMYQMTPMYKELVKCVAILHNVSNTVIAKRKRELISMKQNGTSEGKPESGRSKFHSFLDILLELSEADPTMTPEQIRAEVDTIIVGGQETTASTLMYSMLMIGSKPQVQHKIYDELQTIFGDSKRPVDKEDLVRMTYCEAVIYETLRLYPPIPVVMREATHDLNLQSCTIPRGTKCAINALGAGRSRRSWGPDALEFKPERWLNSAPSATVFLPFSYGKRACIGKKYAMALIKTLLAYTLREVELVADAEKLRFKVDIALRPTYGHLLQVRLRK